MQIVNIATTNANKGRFLAKALAKAGIRAKVAPIDMPEPRSYDLRVIASAKAAHAYGELKRPCVVLDSGFFIPSLNGFPRSFVNFALDTIGVDGILKLAKGTDRRCEFRNCLAYIDGRTRGPILFEAVERGRLAHRKIGNDGDYFWSKLFYVFIPDGERKTLAQMGRDEYEQWHDGVEDYTTKFVVWYRKNRMGL
ncbi:MAG: hypothetical protein KGH98_02970 [Candidatus Micrarchaeota archaeon]|nr:hypothetical protein [Candidatus Micrarchaeota archaeon]